MSVDDAKDSLSMAMPVETGLLVTGQVIMTVAGLGRTLAIGCVTAGRVGPALRPGTLAARPAPSSV